MSNEKKRPTSRKLVPTNAGVSVVPADLLTDVRALIEQARDATARAVNSALVLVYWSIGDRIRRDILKNKRADYGEQILPTCRQNWSRNTVRGSVSGTWYGNRRRSGHLPPEC